MNDTTFTPPLKCKQKFVNKNKSVGLKIFTQIGNVRFHVHVWRRGLDSVTVDRGSSFHSVCLRVQCDAQLNIYLLIHHRLPEAPELPRSLVSSESLICNDSLLLSRFCWLATGLSWNRLSLISLAPGSIVPWGIGSGAIVLPILMYNLSYAPSAYVFHPNQCLRACVYPLHLQQLPIF